MAGYSGRSLAEKLGIRAGCTLAVLGAPAKYRALLGPLPKGVEFCAIGAQPRLIHYFCRERGHLARDLPALRKKMCDDAMLWVSWPKKSGGLATTVTEDTVRKIALPLGLVDTKVCAVDATWSALRLVVRREDRRSGRPARLTKS